MWIESHQQLARHPKVIALVGALGVSKATVIGHLHLLWWWAVDYAWNGDLSRFDDVTIAGGAEWNGDPTVFVSALKTCGWIDEDVCTLHDWDDHAGRLIQRRKANAKRMRSQRQGDVALPNGKRATHVPRPSGATEQYLTNQEQDQDHPPAAADEDAEEPILLTANGISDDQRHLFQRLFAADPRWGQLAPSLVNKLNRDVGKKYVTETLMRLVETPHVDDPAAALVGISKAISQEASA